jgi:hypothetical protein
MDTDSAYFAISGNYLEDVIKPSLKVEFKQNKQFWLGRKDTQVAISGNCLEKVIKPSLKKEFKKNRHLWLGRNDTIENKVDDSRTPGLLKLE